MIELKELVDIVTRNKVKSIEIIGNSNDSDSKLMRLYDLIANEAVKTDDEAFDLLYENIRDKNAYYKLKHLLRERLFNTVFFIDLKEKKYGSIKKASLQCQKMIMLCNILQLKGGIRNSVKIAKQGLKIALEYELTQEIIFLAEKLRMHYATMLGDRKAFQHYDNLVNKYHEIFWAESRAKSRYYDLISLYVNSKSAKSYASEISRRYLDELMALNIKHESIDFFYYKSMIEIIHYMNIADYKTTISLCEVALSKIESHSHLNTKAQLTISLQYIACCIHLKLYDKGRSTIEKFLSKVEEGAYTWFKLQELYLTLCLHTKNYAEAWRTYQLATGHKKFQSLFANAQEVWKIYEAWLYFLLRAGKVGTLNGSTYKNFRIGRFLNEVPTFSKDKRGLNVPILIVQIVLLLQAGRRDELIDRMEAIAKYKHRYLDKDQNYRSDVFIRMLLEVSRASFRQEGAMKRTRKYHSMLSEVPLEVSNQSHDLEILPYEDIWEIVVEQLD